MTLHFSYLLGIAFALTGLTNAVLAAWLWTFPMAPDPGGPDPNGKSTAPPFLTGLHRLLGFIFVLLYIALMFEMVPRLWEHKEGLEGGVLVHIALGLAIGILLIFKILIIRKFQQFGKKLPLLGGSIAAFGLILIGIVIGPASRIVLTPPVTTSAAFQKGWVVAATKCQQCHGSGTIFKEGRTQEGWSEVFEEMLEESNEAKVASPLAPDEGQGVAEYLYARAPGIKGPEKESEKGRDQAGRRESEEDDD